MADKAEPKLCLSGNCENPRQDFSVYCKDHDIVPTVRQTFAFETPMKNLESLIDNTQEKGK